MSLLALILAAMHSSPRFKGKLTERWGRKASGLRDACAYDSGVAGPNVNALRLRGSRAASQEGRSDRPIPRSSWRSTSVDEGPSSPCRTLGQSEIAFVVVEQRFVQRA